MANVQGEVHENQRKTSGAGVSFMMREVTLGAALGASYIIEEGLEPGEEIAVNGTFSIDAAAQLAGKPSMMSPEGGPVMTGHNHASLPDVQRGSTSITPTSSNQKHTEKVSINTQTKEVIKPLFMDYLNIKDALVVDDFEKAQKAALLFQDDLSKINKSLFTGNAHEVWMKLSSEAKQAIEHAAHFQNISDIRKAFLPLSKAMIGLAKSFDPLDEGVYIQHCPMADGNKGGDRLSLSDEIKNPYFGTAMLTCGEVVSTIR